MPDSDWQQPGHIPAMIAVIAGHLEEASIQSYPLNAQERLESDWSGHKFKPLFCQ